jgi:hypothetical protein
VGGLDFGQKSYPDKTSSETKHPEKNVLGDKDNIFWHKTFFSDNLKKT